MQWQWRNASEKERNDDPFADHDEPLYQARRQDLSAGRQRLFPQPQVDLLIVDARHLLPAAVGALGSRAGRPEPGGAGRFSRPALLFLLHRDLAAGGLLPHRPADARRARPVPDERSSPAGSGAAITCPQTVWTDLFMLVERKIEGDRRERIGLDAEPWSAAKVAAKAASISSGCDRWWTGGAWVLYFADAPTLVWQLATFQAPAIAWISIGILTFTTYSLAGLIASRSAPTCARGRASRRRC
jgi:hypothetical protein